MNTATTSHLGRRGLLKCLLAGIPGLFLPSVATARRTVVLNRCHVAGFQFHEGIEARQQIQVGDELRVVAEPENPHDRYAVALHWKGRHIGYVPRRENRHLSRMLRSDVPLVATVTQSIPDADPWRAVRVDVAMVVG